MNLKELVYNFRNAIERAKDNNEPDEFFRKFPNGQCGAYGGGEWSPGRSPVAAERPSGREGRWRRTMVIQCQQ